MGKCLADQATAAVKLKGNSQTVYFKVKLINCHVKIHKIYWKELSKNPRHGHNSVKKSFYLNKASFY